MRFAISVISPEVSGEAPLALLEGTFDQRLEKAAALGYQGVELVVSDPLRLGPKALLAQMARHGLVPAAVATGFVFGSRGLQLVNPDETVRRLAAELLQDLVRLAAALGVSVVTIGGFRGKAAPVGGPETARKMLHESLRAAEPLAKQLGITIALEPLRHAESDLLNSAQEVCQFIEEGGHEAVGLLLDVYHMMGVESDLPETIRACRDKLVHVHLADTGRRALGQGTFDFAPIEAALREIGYTGWQSVELPRSDDPDGNACLPHWFLEQ